MSGAAEELFAHYVSHGWTHVLHVIATELPETLHVDFKRKSNPTHSGLDKDDRKNLGEAVSGVANSDGGVIIWGLETQRSDAGDFAAGVQPLADAPAFARSLAELTPEIVSPPIVGLRHIAIENPSNPPAGVVVTLVPESDITPHMARGPSQQRYYRRSGASFRPMEHYEIADLFGRRAHPVIDTEFKYDARLSRSGTIAIAEFRASLILRNRGRGLARYLSLALTKPQGYQVRHWTGESGGYLPLRLIPAPAGWWLRYAGGSGIVIYPDDEFTVTTLSFEISNQEKHFPSLSLRCQAFAAEAEAVVRELVISGEEIRAAVKPVFAAAGFRLEG
jgi:hypothetical protein